MLIPEEILAIAYNAYAPGSSCLWDGIVFEEAGSIRVKAPEAAQRHFLQRDAPATAPRGARIVVVAGAFFVY
jgi:hypothetical protein